MGAKPHQPAGRTAALRRDRQPPGRGEVERARVAPQFADHGGEARASYPLLHRPQRIAGVARLDMNEFLRRQPRRMDPSALEDRHAVLDPEQRLGRVDLRQQEPGPTAVVRVRGKQFGEGGVGRRRQPPALAQPAGETICFSRTAPAAGDQGQASCHTTHNASVLLLFLSRDSRARVNGATQAPCPRGENLIADDLRVELRQFLVSAPGRKCRRLFSGRPLLGLAAASIIESIERDLVLHSLILAPRRGRHVTGLFRNGNQAARSFMPAVTDAQRPAKNRLVHRSQL